MTELETRKSQCQKDIAKLQEELKLIEKEIEDSKKPKVGDRYRLTHVDYEAVVTRINGKMYYVYYKNSLEPGAAYSLDIMHSSQWIKLTQ